jgi:hypothetical protein
MTELTALQFDILDALYFVEPLEHILAEVGQPPNIVQAELKALIEMGLVAPMVFDEKSQDFVRTAFHDADHLGEFRYVATKAGLLAHNGHGK